MWARHDQSTLSQPKLVLPDTYHIGSLLEATHLPEKFRESRGNVVKMWCAAFSWVVVFDRFNQNVPATSLKMKRFSLHLG